ncbi:PREDICTED: protein bark beetle-like [Branchiostoma belcheri]|uniref:Protein bark beetle-like n=1 Tax=Branchiostoma belcheri TaxID=7741 RepID=A0A6P4YCJ9_BRABE|nr:PREDICTED: protein bark beetle-like [Branchiostoma belcheri]
MGPLWRRVFLVSLLLLGLLSGGVSDDIGGSFVRNHTIILSGSPYNVTDEIIVGEEVTLTIEAGVRLLFPERVGMTVLGRLIAIGNSSDRIVFDRKRNPPDYQPNYATRDHDIRLLGPTVFEGRVQVKLNGTWGSLCLQHSWQQWRTSEATVVCQQLGFANGRVESRYRYGTGRMAVCNLECQGNEDNIFECRHDDLDQPPQCSLTCEPTPGWGGIRSYSSEPVNISNTNFQYVGQLHNEKASALSVQNDPYRMLFNEIHMTNFVDSQTGIELLPVEEVYIENVTIESCATEAGISVLDPQQSVIIRSSHLTNTGNRIGGGIGIKMLDTLSWSDLHEQAESGSSMFVSMCRDPPIINLRPGLRQWLVHGIVRGVTSSCLKNIQAPHGYRVQLNMKKSEFDYGASDNNLTVYDSSTMNDSCVLGTVDYYNSYPGVFTSSGSILTLQIKAKQGRRSLFLAEVRATPDAVHSTSSPNESTRKIFFQDSSVTNFDNGIQINIPKAYVHIERSTFRSCYRGTYVTNTAGNKTILGSTFGENTIGLQVSNTEGLIMLEATVFDDNNGYGSTISSSRGDIFVSDVLAKNNHNDGLYFDDIGGDVTLTNMSALDNNGYGIKISSSRGDMFVSDILTMSNTNGGLYLNDVSGDVTLTNVSSLDNRGDGIKLYTITCTVVAIETKLQSNSGQGITLMNVFGTSSISDVTVTGNSNGLYIYHDSQTRGSYNITDFMSDGNRGAGVLLQLSYRSHVYIFNSHINGNWQGGVSVDITGNSIDQYPQITMTNNTVANNKRFALHGKGELANFEISWNSINQNSCPYQPVVAFKGKPKCINFCFNNVSNNNAREIFSVLFEDQSRVVEKSRVLITDNIINENFYSPSETDGNFQYSPYPDPYSCTIEIGGYNENYTVTHNLIDNANMNHTLCSRVGTTFPDETINAKYNWWGTVDEKEIQNKVVDFDDWNDRALVDYFPYLTGPDVNSQPAEPSIQNITMTTDDIGGRLYGTLHLTESGSPYTIKKDLTILENASVTVEPGVQIRFHPCELRLNR